MSMQSLIEKKIPDIKTVMKSKDYEGAMNKYFTENCSLMPPTGEIISGRKDAAAFFQKTYGDIKDAEYDAKILEVNEDGNLATTRCCYKVTKGGQEVLTGTFVHIWKKVNGDVFIHTEIWTEKK